MAVKAAVHGAGDRQPDGSRGFRPPPAGAADRPGLLRLELGGSFARQPNKPTEFQTSIPQALALMNGKYINDATAVERSGTLAAVAGAPFLERRGRVETLYFAALGRKPTDAESAKLAAYVEKGGPSGDPNLRWPTCSGVLNSSEFVFNH